MRTLPDREAQDVLQRLRSGADVAAILNQVKAGNLLLQMAVTPETRLRYEFPYRSEMPFDCGPDNPYLDSLIYEAASLYSTDRVGPVHNLGQDGYQSLSQAVPCGTPDGPAALGCEAVVVDCCVR